MTLLTLMHYKPKNTKVGFIEFTCSSLLSYKSYDTSITGTFDGANLCPRISSILFHMLTETELVSGLVICFLS